MSRDSKIETSWSELQFLRLLETVQHNRLVKENLIAAQGWVILHSFRGVGD